MTYCKLRTVRLACTVSLFFYLLKLGVVSAALAACKWDVLIHRTALTLFPICFYLSVPNHRPADGSHCTEHPRIPCSFQQTSGHVTVFLCVGWRAFMFACDGSHVCLFVCVGWCARRVWGMCVCCPQISDSAGSCSISSRFLFSLSTAMMAWTFHFKFVKIFL